MGANDAELILYGIGKRLFSLIPCTLYNLVAVDQILLVTDQRFERIGTCPVEFTFDVFEQLCPIDRAHGHTEQTLYLVHELRLAGLLCKRNHMVAE